MPANVNTNKRGGPMTRQPRLLVVEDDAQLRESMVRVLQFCGYAVDVAADAREGLAHVQRDRYDAVVTDIAMEGNGFTVLAMIGELDGSTPVVAVSGLDTPGLSEVVREAGARVFLQKPFGLTQLREAVGRVLEENER